MKTTPGDIIVLNMSIKNYDVRFLRYEVGRRAIKLHMFEKESEKERKRERERERERDVCFINLG